MKKLFAFLLTLALLANLTVGVTATESSQTKVFNFLDSYTAEELAELTADPDDYYVSVFVEFAYPEMDTEGLDELDRPSRNAAIRNYHMMQNLAIATQLGIPADAISSYAPYAELRYESIAAYEAAEDFVYSLGESEDVQDVEISISKAETFGTREPNGTTPSIYPWDDIRDDIGFEDNDYYGEDLKIGFLEKSTVMTAYIPSTRLVQYGEMAYDPDEGDNADDINDRHHAYDTTYITASDYSMCVGATYYVSSLRNTNWKTALERLMDANVDLINISVGDISNGGYDQRAAYIDYLIYASDTAMIVAADNDNPNDVDTLLDSPATAANCITVTATTVNKKVYHRSNYQDTHGAITKPDLAAPGVGIVTEPSPDFSTVEREKRSGSSYAAPFVTAIAARLMDEFPVLQNNPWLLKAVLTASCTWLPDQTTEQDQYAGAGLVNYGRARQIMLNQWYGSFEKPYDELEGAYMLYFELDDAPAGSTIDLRYAIPIPGTSYSAPAAGTAATLDSFSTYRCFSVNTVTQDFVSTVTDYNSGILPCPTDPLNDMNYIVEVYLESDVDPFWSEELFYAYYIDYPDGYLY